MKLRFGVGTIVAIALTVVLVGIAVFRLHQRFNHPPVIERIIQGSASPGGIAPTPEFLLRHRTDLALTETQVKQITAIARNYRRDVAPIEQPLAASKKNYEKYMERAMRAHRLNPQQNETQSAEMQRLSSIKVTTRHSYWQQARAILTADQRRRLDCQLMPHVTLQDLQ